MADNVIPMPVNPTAPGLPPPGPPPQSVQIMLPPPLQEIMQQFPDVVKRLGALEAKHVSVAPSPTKLMAAFFFLAGSSSMALLVWLWFYAAVIFRL